jgi:hypothetical protein
MVVPHPAAVMRTKVVYDYPLLILRSPIDVTATLIKKLKRRGEKRIVDVSSNSITDLQSACVAYLHATRPEPTDEAHLHVTQHLHNSSARELTLVTYFGIPEVR